MKWILVSTANLISNIHSQLKTIYNRDKLIIVYILKFEKKFCQVRMTVYVREWSKTFKIFFRTEYTIRKQTLWCLPFVYMSHVSLTIRTVPKFGKHLGRFGNLF